MSEFTPKRYPCTCAACNRIFYAMKSIAQEWGMNDMGHGSCPKCNQFQNLTFDPATEVMITKKFEKHVAEIKRALAKDPPIMPSCAIRKREPNEPSSASM